MPEMSTENKCINLKSEEALFKKNRKYHAFIAPKLKSVSTTMPLEVVEAVNLKKETSFQKEITWNSQIDIDIPLPKRRTPPETDLTVNTKTKITRLLAPLEEKRQFISSKSVTASEQKLKDIVHSDHNLPLEPVTTAKYTKVNEENLWKLDHTLLGPCMSCHDKANVEHRKLLTLLPSNNIHGAKTTWSRNDEDSSKENEEILQYLDRQYANPLPDTETFSRKKQICKVFAGLNHPLEPKTIYMMEKCGNAADAQFSQSLKDKPFQEKDRILKGLIHKRVPLPEKHTPPDVSLKGKPKGKRPKHKEKILRGLAMQGIPLPEDKTANEKKLIEKTRTYLGLPPEPDTAYMKEKYAKAAVIGLLKPLEGKKIKEKQTILQKFSDKGIPLPKRRTPSECDLIKKIKAKDEITKITLETIVPTESELENHLKTKSKEQIILNKKVSRIISLPEKKLVKKDYTLKQETEMVTKLMGSSAMVKDSLALAPLATTKNVGNFKVTEILRHDEEKSCTKEEKLLNSLSKPEIYKQEASIGQTKQCTDKKGSAKLLENEEILFTTTTEIRLPLPEVKDLSERESTNEIKAVTCSTATSLLQLIKGKIHGAYKGKKLKTQKEMNQKATTVETKNTLKSRNKIGIPLFERKANSETSAIIEISSKIIQNMKAEHLRKTLLKNPKSERTEIFRNQTKVPLSPLESNNSSKKSIFSNSLNINVVRKSYFLLSAVRKTKCQKEKSLLSITKIELPEAEKMTLVPKESRSHENLSQISYKKTNKIKMKSTKYVTGPLKNIDKAAVITRELAISKIASERKKERKKVDIHHMSSHLLFYPCQVNYIPNVNDRIFTGNENEEINGCFSIYSNENINLQKKRYKRSSHDKTKSKLPEIFASTGRFLFDNKYGLSDSSNLEFNLELCTRNDCSFMSTSKSYIEIDDRNNTNKNYRPFNYDLLKTWPIDPSKSYSSQYSSASDSAIIDSSTSAQSFVWNCECNEEPGPDVIISESLSSTSLTISTDSRFSKNVDSSDSKGYSESISSHYIIYSRSDDVSVFDDSDWMEECYRDSIYPAPVSSMR